MRQSGKLPQLKPIVVSTSIAMALMFGTTYAQTAPETVVPNKSADVVDNGIIQEVVVTAQKRKEKQNEVPSSISVVDQQQLENQHITQLSDLAGQLPSLQINNLGTAGQTSVALRGIPAIGPGAVVGTYVDDSPLGSSNNYNNGSLFVLDLLPYDVADMELLRGPQGTLYGASTMGGLLKYSTVDPDLNRFYGRVGGGFSSVDGASGHGSDERITVNAPVIDGKLAIRASFSNNETPGWISNSVSGAQGINSDRQQSARIAVLWKPDSDIRLKVSVMRQTIDAQDNSIVPLDPTTLAPLFGANTAGKYYQESFRKNINYSAATLNWDLHWADFVSATSYSTASTNQLQDATPSYGALFPLLGNFPAGTSGFGQDWTLNKFTQEFRLASKQTGKLEWLIGGFYTKENSGNNEVLSADTFAGAPIAGLDPLAAIELPSMYREEALFADATYKFTDSFDVTAGLRDAKNNQTFSQTVSAGIVLPLGTQAGNSSENVTTYLFSPRYHLNEDSILYARVASGYRPGGPNVALAGVPPSVKSDTLVSEEVGLKTLLLNRHLSVDLAAFDIKWKDIQVGAVSSGGVGYLANGGTAQSKGFEMSTVAKPAVDWKIALNASYTDAYLTADAPSINGKNGDQLGGIPHWIASTFVDHSYALPDGWAGHSSIGYSWTSSQYMEVVSAPGNYKLPDLGFLNLNTDISRGIWTVRLYAKNLTNTQKYTYLTPIANNATGANAQIDSIRPQPRTVGLEFDAEF